ncbi:CRS1 protein [Burkholderiales bacterium]|nr:CRS1 protein [Burkholderiales bacterium]
MAELSLSHEQCLRLRAQAHRLNPVVLLGAAGLSDAALREIDRALRSHGLIKVRAAGADRADRDVIFRAMAEPLGAARVQVIGNTFVLFRPLPRIEPPAAAAGAPKRGASARSGAPLDARAARRAPKPPPPGSGPRRAPGRGARQR